MAMCEIHVHPKGTKRPGRTVAFAIGLGLRTGGLSLIFRCILFSLLWLLPLSPSSSLLAAVSSHCSGVWF